MENLEQLEKFIQERNFSDPIFADVFKFIKTKYPDEMERRTAIRAMIEIWRRKYPNEMDKFESDMKRRHELKKDKFSSTDDNADIRVLFTIPESLHTRINMVVKDPPFLSGEAEKQFNESEWFFDEFPAFRTAEVY